MFDVSFFELLVIGVVALVVIGPEKLPGAIRTCALWIGRMKRILAESRSEFEKHIGADEIRRELHNEQIMASLEKLKASRAILEQDLLNYQNTLQAELNALEHGAEVTPSEHTQESAPHSGTSDTELTSAEHHSNTTTAEIPSGHSDTLPHDSAPITKSTHD
ncbi:MAG TPA: Sec-independent protein translocase protein TatB [Cellvibrionaceae bacterium]|nr:Sec-independent protein translocase protein TatB [Cellvibrionaceae bacterium]HMW71471.1 Sec-independent protein translocase protein TatB [Cellvibrionaceae bacterium]HNG60217.1 Sec-independent protein translocase protein TatB [Cellvibrionaceae bacterium]